MWIGSVGRHRYDRIRCNPIVQVDGAECAESQGVVADAVSITEQSGVFR